MLYFSYAFGLITIIGGIIGYTKGSSVSLIMGGVFGILILLSTFILQRDNALGFYALSALSVLLLGTFAYRLYSTGGTMPAIPMIVLSIIMLIGLWLNRSNLLQQPTP